MEYTYAALLLHKVGKDINEDNVKAVVAATGAEVDEAKVKVMVAALKDVDVADKLANASVAAAPAAGAAPADAGDAPKEEEKKKEEPKVESAAGLASLFG
ncbi:50S ribosomal protein P1 [Methanococcoides sp. SA1]|nr:50S ribosomal protein P1 [Methanococcoides sp. SA1]